MSSLTVPGRRPPFGPTNEPGPPSRPESGTVVDDWLVSVWPMALLFHLFGNSGHLSALVNGHWNSVAVGQVAMAVAAVAVIISGRRQSVAALATIHLTVTIDKLPAIGNHELILALMSLALLVALFATRSRSQERIWTDIAGPGLRWLFLVSYGTIAFSKLNAGFLDLASSCATLFGDESGQWLGVTVSDHTVLAAVAVYGTVIIELLVPILLLVPRTRWYGLLLGLGFHGVLALDPTTHVFDFTSTLTPLLLLFAPVTVRRELARSLRGLRLIIGPRSLLAGLGVILTGHLLILRLGLYSWLVAYPLWLGATTTLVVWLIRRHPSLPRDGTDAAALGRPSRALVLVVALAALNGAAPYLELKTATGFNMYSNLHTAQGRSNHLLVPATVPLRGLDLVTVEASDHDALAYYVDSDLALPRENVERVLGVVLEPEIDALADGRATGHVDALRGLILVDTATGGRLMATESLEKRSFGWRVGDWMAHKFALRRSVVTSEPRACLRSWGPAF